MKPKFFDRVMLKVLQRYLKDSSVGRAIQKYYLSEVQWTPKTFKAFAEEGYKMNPHVYACINQIAKNFSCVPWYLIKKKKTKNGKDEEIESHPLIELMDRPNPNQGGVRFRENLIAYLMMSGNSYMERVGVKNKPPSELYILRPDRVSILPGRNIHSPKGYRYSLGSEDVDIKPDFIMHMLLLDPLDDWYGMSPLSAASRSADMNNESRKWNVTMLQNDCIAPGVLETQKGLTDIQFHRLENKWRDKYVTGGNQFTGDVPIILEGGLKWTAMGVNPKDMSWIEGLKMSSREIATAFNVPPELIGDSENKTYSNYKEARKALYEETIIPLLDFFADEVNVWLTPLYGNDSLKLVYDKDSIEALREDRDALYKRLNESYDLKINEKRVAKGYEEISEEEGGNLIVIPAKTSSLQSLLEKKVEPEEENVINDEEDDEEDEDEKGNFLTYREASIKLRSVKRLLTDEEKEEYFHAFESKREPFYQNASGILAKHFENEHQRIKYFIHNNPTWMSNIDSVVNNSDDDLKTIIDGIYKSVSEEFAKDLIISTKCFLSGRSVKEEFNVDLSDLIVEIDGDEVDIATQATSDYLKYNSASKVAYISETTREQIRDELEAGVANGESMDDIAKRLDALYLDKIIKNRSLTIARTEVVAASNLGSRSAALGLDIPGMTKSWLATDDKRTREWHREADGQETGMEDPYQVNGELLMFPGDSSLGASASNIVKCRCCEVYDVPE